MKTKEEVLIKLGEQTKKVNVEFANISEILQTELGKGDVKIVEARKKIKDISDGYKEAISIYSNIESTAVKYLDMAKALGDDNMISRLTKNIKDAKEMIKISNTVISKINSL